MRGDAGMAQGAERASEELGELFKAREFDAGNIDFGRLFEQCFGWQNFRACREKKQLAHEVFRSAVTEAQGAISTAAFLNVIGQIAYSTFLQAYEKEASVFTPLIPEVRTEFLDGEKVAGVTGIADEVQVRPEGERYTLAGVGEDWIFTPPVIDRGQIMPVTWEAVFADRTGQLLPRLGQIGQSAGLNREKRAIDCVIDENTTAHRHNWRGTTIASYGDNSGSHSWDNLSATTTLTDWTSLDRAEQVFNGITDPYTAEPWPVDPRHLIVAKINEQTARRVLSATEIRVATPGYATTGNPTLTNMTNPYGNKFTLVTSRLLNSRMTVNTSWYLGDLALYARYMVAEPQAVVQAPTNDIDEFERRIVAKYRVNERGAYVVFQPRAMVKCTVA